MAGEGGRGWPVRVACENGQPGAGWHYAMGGRSATGLGQNERDSGFKQLTAIE